MVASCTPELVKPAIDLPLCYATTISDKLHIDLDLDFETYRGNQTQVVGWGEADNGKHFQYSDIFTHRICNALQCTMGGSNYSGGK